MRLLSLRVQNYRIHRDQTVEFDAQRTLIGGANETGKSTLVEAAHRALFMNHRRGGQIQEAMKSRHGSEPPEVQLRFESGGVEYDLSKVFNRAKGSAELRDANHQQWTGTDAEQKLAELLGYDEPVGAAQADAQWAHLWIRQGNSANDPTSEAPNEQDDLLARIQAIGGGAVMQSPRDHQVAERFLETEASLFNQNGSPKANSELARATSAVEQARERRDQLLARTEQLQRAIQDHHSAQEKITRATDELPTLTESLKSTEGKLKEAEKLQQQNKQSETRLKQVTEQHQKLKTSDAGIRRLEVEVAHKEAAIQPKKETIESLSKEHAATEKDLNEATGALEAAELKTRALRAHMDLTRLHRDRFVAETKQAKLSAQKKDINALSEQLKAPTAQLAKLPKIEDSQVNRLRQLAGDRDKAQAALDAIATGIEWQAGDTQVSLDGIALTKGEAQVISETGTLKIGDSVIRIHPGGGDRLEASLDQLKQAKRDLKDLLETLQVEHLDAAIECHANRQTLGHRIEQLKDKIESQDPESVESELTELRTHLLTLTSEIERQTEKVESFAAPSDESAATEQFQKFKTDLTSADVGESEARGTAKALKQKFADQNQQLKKLEIAYREEEQSLKDQQTTRQTLIQEHGDQDARAQGLADTQQAVETTTKENHSIRKQLKSLQPEVLDSDFKRLSRSIQQQQDNLTSAGEALAVAKATLKSDGSSDPHADLHQAEEALQAANEELATATRRGASIRKLAELFRDERQQLADLFTQPLGDKVAEYLRCLFGADTHAKVSLTDGQFEGLEINRALGQFSFDTLSGGTKEQVAAAMRLAVAELLATDHDGCLPIVFDDSFTHSDPQRVKDLQRMLDRAADRGVQVIVLTCTPSDYTTLGALEVMLAASNRPELQS